MEELEPLVSKREHKGKGKDEGKLPLICFSCNKKCHFASRCPRVPKYKAKPYNSKFSMECCYVIKDGSDNEFEKSEDEISFVAIKDF